MIAIHPSAVVGDIQRTLHTTRAAAKPVDLVKRWFGLGSPYSDLMLRMPPVPKFQPQEEESSE